MILIGDISREVPNLIDRMIENGIFNSILNRLKQKIPNDADTIPMIIYFLNMFCMVENGKKLEDEFNILEKIFETLMDNDFVETLYSGNKGSSNIGKCVASIVQEICEMLNTLDVLKQKVINLIFEFMHKFVQHQEELWLQMENNLKDLNMVEIQSLEIFQFEKQSQKVSNQVRFYSKFFQQSSPLILELLEKNSMEDYIQLMNNPYMLLHETGRQHWLCCKALVIESKYASYDLLPKLVEILEKQLDKFELKTGKFSNINDLTHLISLDDMVQFRIHGLSYLYTQKKYDQICLLNQLAYVEFIIEFIRLLTAHKVKLNTQISIIFERLGDLYRVYMNQLFLEDVHFNKLQDQNLEKGFEGSWRQQFLINLRKFFAQILKSSGSQDRNKIDQKIIKTYIMNMVQVIQTLQLNDLNFEMYLHNQKECTVKLLGDINSLENFNHLLLQFFDLNKKGLIFHPQAFQTIAVVQLYEEYIFDIFFHYARRFTQFYKQVINHKDLVEKLTSLDVLMKQITCFIKNLIFLQFDTQLPVYINQKLESGKQLQQYLNNIKYEHAQLIFELLENLQDLAPIQDETIQAFFAVIFEKVQKIIADDDQKQKIPHQNRHRGHGLMQEMENLQENVLEQLQAMGFSQERAQQALNNIEFPEITMATEWLFTHADEPDNQMQIENVPIRKMSEDKKRIHKVLNYTKQQKELKRLDDAQFTQSILKILLSYERFFLREIYFFENYAVQISMFLTKLIENQPSQEEKKQTFQELIYIILATIKQSAQAIFKKFNMNIGIRGRHEIIQLLKEGSLIKDSPHISSKYNGYSQSQQKTFEKLRIINIMLGLFLNISQKITDMASNYAINKKLGLEFLKFTNYILENMEELLIVKQQPINDTAFKIFEDYFLKIFIVLDKINDLATFCQLLNLIYLILIKVFKMDNEDVSKMNRDKRKQTKKDDDDDDDVDEFPQHDFGKQIIKFQLKSLNLINSFYEKQNRSLFNKFSFEGFLRILNGSFEQDNENSKLFIKHKGLNELFKLKFKPEQTLYFSGMLEIVSKNLLNLISDQELDDITLECKLKGFFIEKEKQKYKLEDFSKFFKEHKSQQNFIDIVQEICVIEEENNVKYIQLKPSIDMQRIYCYKIRKESIKPASNEKILYQPKIVTQSVISLFIDQIVTDFQSSQVNFVFTHTLLLKCLHIILRKYPILTSSFMKFNCSKLIRKTNMHSAFNNYLTNASFLTLFINSILFTSLDNIHLLFEICLNNSNLSQVTQQKSEFNTQEIRKKILQDIYQVNFTKFIN